MKLRTRGFRHGGCSNDRARAQLICTRPQNYMPARAHEAVAYLLQMSNATEDERRLTSEAIEWLEGRRDEPKPAVAKPKRKGR
jgi:hypothetical protein